MAMRAGFCLVSVLMITGMLCADESSPLSPLKLERPKSIPEALWQTLVEMDQRAAETRTLMAQFVQEKKTPLLRRPITSSGSVTAVEGRVLWRTEAPAVSEMLIDRQAIRFYYPDQKLIERYPLQGRAAEMAAGPLMRLEALVKMFRLTPVDVVPQVKDLEKDADVSQWIALQIEPVDEARRESFGTVLVIMDPKTATLRRFVREDADGERTSITLKDVRINDEAAPKEVNLSAPPETREVRPLGDQDP